MLGIKNFSLSVLVYALSLKVVNFKTPTSELAQEHANRGVVGYDEPIGDVNTLTSRGVDVVSTRYLVKDV